MSFSLPKTFFEIYKLQAWIETRWFHCTVKGKKKKKPVTNSKPSCVDFFFFHSWNTSFYYSSTGMAN